MPEIIAQSILYNSPFAHSHCPKLPIQKQLCFKKSYLPESSHFCHKYLFEVNTRNVVNF